MTLTHTPPDQVAGIVAGARTTFRSGRTAPMSWRRSTLQRVRALLGEHEERLLAALADDLGKPPLEAWVTELGFCLSDIGHTLAHLDQWARPERVATPLTFQPGSSHVHPEPLGVVAVIAPWNYPVQLLLSAACAAIAAGNAVVLKPSELAPSTAAALGALIADLADPAVVVIQGGVAETTELLAQRFDHIVYTGNGNVAKVVMRAAAEHLTPVTLELGGKSPALVSRHADVAVAAKRIAWGKFVNAGQTCIAPDYVLVERPVHDQLVAALGAAITELYGADPRASADYGRIVNDNHFHRLEKLLHSGTVAFGGQADADARYIAPTVLTGITLDDPPMAEEIFGPVLPVLAVDDLDAAIAIVNGADHPLALYVFSEDHDETDQVIASATSGGACVNGTLMHVANPNLPFGGVGPSGMGAYHGRAGFDRLSHHRSVHTRSTKLDPALLYPPYTAAKSKLVKRGLRMADPRDMWASAVGRVRRGR